MKISIEIECPAWMRRAVAFFAPALAIGVAGVALGVPKTFVSGETLTAADLNASLSEVASMTSSWTAYTPAVTAGGNPIPTTVTGTSASAGYWRRVGDTMEVMISTTHPTCPSGAAPIYWSIPSQYSVDAAKLPEANAVVGTGLALNGGASQYTSAHAIVNGSTVALIFNFNAVSCGIIGDGGNVRLIFSVPIQGWTAAS